MVNEICIDLLNNANELDCTARRCVQCGDIIDAVIERNRHLGQAPVTSFSPSTRHYQLEAPALI